MLLLSKRGAHTQRVHVWLRAIGSCPTCGASSPRALDHVLDRASDKTAVVSPVSGCETCGLVFVNPLPSQAEIAAYRPGGEWAVVLPPMPAQAVESRRAEFRRRKALRKLEKEQARARKKALAATR